MSLPPDEPPPDATPPGDAPPPGDALPDALRPDVPPPASAAEVEAEALRLMRTVIDGGLRVRLMGGLAIRIQSPTASK